MSEVLFKCPNCSMSLCTSDSAIGSALTCPSCHGNIMLPEPDFSFSCPSCDTKHLAPANMGNEPFQCPACTKQFTIPVSGTKYFQPLKSKQKTIACPSCSSQLEIDDRVFTEMAGQQVDCPMCKNRISIPLQSKKSLLRPPTGTSLKVLSAPPITVPPASASRTECPACKMEMPQNAVICVSCGFDLRTGQNIAGGVNLQGERKESRLAFKNGKPADPALNPALSRFPLGPFLTWRGMVMWFRFKSATRSIAAVLITTAICVGILYFVDLGNSEAESWKIAVQSLRALKSKPADTNTLDAIKGVIPRMENDMTGNTPKAGLMAVWAIGQLELGNIDRGIKACQWITGNYADTRFAREAALSNFSNTCQTCNGKVQVCTNCGGGTAACLLCGGSGIWQAKNMDIPRQLQPERPETLRKIHRLGDTQAKNFSDTPPVKLTCNSCNGTGKAKACTICKGTGNSPAKCSQCKGQGWSLLKEQVHNQYIAVINREYWYVSAKFAFEKLRDTGILLQKLLHIQRHEANPAPPENNTLVNILGTTDSIPANIDWEKRYDESYKICTDIFIPPALEKHISIRVDGGNMQEGTLVSLTETNLEIRTTNATIGFRDTQLDTESRIRCFRKDFAAFYAGKKYEAEKAEAGQTPK